MLFYIFYQKKFSEKIIFKKLVTLIAGVNFTNFIRAHILPIFFCLKGKNPNFKYRKAAHKVLVTLTTGHPITTIKRALVFKEQCQLF
jgi:hypothetical protein